MPKVLRIIESYCLLNGNLITEVSISTGTAYLLIADLYLQKYGPNLFSAFQFLLGDLKLWATRGILRVLNTICMTCPAAQWVPSMDTSNCFIGLLQPLQKEVFDLGWIIFPIAD